MPSPHAECRTTKLWRRTAQHVLATLCLLVLRVPFTAWAAEQKTLSGKVTDRSGAVIARAQVTLYSEGRQFNRWTQPDGSFLFEGLTVPSGELVVAAQGFATNSSPWRGENQVMIALNPAPVQQSLDVTATRTAILPTGVDKIEAQPNSAVLPTSLLQQWGSLTIDDKMRQVLGFSLLRRWGA